MAYSLSPTGPYTKITDPGFGTNYIASLDFDGTYYVAVGDGGKIRYTTDLTSATTWSTPTSPGFGTSAVLDVKYAAGNWVAVGVAANLLRTTTDPTGTWSAPTSFAMPSYVLCVAFDGTYWAVGGGGGNIRYATNPAGTWSSATSSIPNDIYSIAYGGGYWVAGSASNPGPAACTYKAADPTGTWTVNTTNVNFSGSGVIYIQRWSYHTNFWVCCGLDQKTPNVSLAKYVVGAPNQTWSSCSITTGADSWVSAADGIFLFSATTLQASITPAPAPTVSAVAVTRSANY